MVRASRDSAEAAPPLRSAPAGSGSDRGGPYTKARRSDNAGSPVPQARLCGKPSHPRRFDNPSPGLGCRLGDVSQLKRGEVSGEGALGRAPHNEMLLS